MLSSWVQGNSNGPLVPMVRLASSQATAEKRARQIQFVKDNVDIKYINGFTTTLIIARQTPRQQSKVTSVTWI